MARVKNLVINNKELLDLFYPIGSLYTTFDDAFDPNVSFGGTWNRVKGKFIFGTDPESSDYSESGLVGGELSHTLTINEMPSHNHDWLGVNDGTTVKASMGNYPFRIYQDKAYNWNGASAHIQNRGSSKPHNNMPPYVTGNMWVRNE